ncbi:MAG: EamA family transporter, partial [Pseudomonadota bacterium]
MPHLPVPLRGPLWIVLASVFFAAGWAFIKLAGETVHPFQVVFFRCIIGAAFLAPLILSRRIELSAARFGGHALRATAGLIVMFATFYALANAPISTV